MGKNILEPSEYKLRWEDTKPFIGGISTYGERVTKSFSKHKIPIDERVYMRSIALIAYDFSLIIGATWLAFRGLESLVN